MRTPIFCLQSAEFVIPYPLDKKEFDAMQYIILDMEWNQPWPGSYSAKKALPSPMRGEIVQIGAVRMTQEQQVADEFQILIRPKYF